MYPSTITKLFRPFPTILRKDYVFHLFYHRINPYSFYPEEHFPILDEYQNELRALLDVYEPYLVIKVFPEYGKNIAKENKELYDRLCTKVEDSRLFKPILTKRHKKAVKELEKSNIYNYI